MSLLQTVTASHTDMPLLSWSQKIAQDCQHAPSRSVRSEDRLANLTLGPHRYVHHTSISGISDTRDPSKQRKSPHRRASKWAILGSNQ
ncbi:MAG: hypothetical protein ACRDKD_06140 [Solirubrobacteraceae bacterium]